MDTFYCVNCRFSYPTEKAGHLTPGAHRDGDPVGFCFLCVRELLPELAGRTAPAEQDVADSAPEPAASA